MVAALEEECHEREVTEAAVVEADAVEAEDMDNHQLGDFGDLDYNREGLRLYCIISYTAVSHNDYQQ